MHEIYIILLNVFWITCAKSSESDQNITEVYYDVGDTLVFSCEEHISKSTVLYWHRVIDERGGNRKIGIPESNTTNIFTYTITTYEFDHGSKIYCIASIWDNTYKFLRSDAIKLVYTGSSNNATDEIYYNEEHPAYRTCDKPGEHVPINSTLKTIEGHLAAAPNIHDKYILKASDSGSVFLCSILDHIKLEKRYIREIYNMAKYIYTPAKSEENFLLLIGICLELVVCLILAATFLFLRFKRKKNEQSPAPNQIIYAELELPRATSTRIPQHTNETTYSQIIGYVAEKY